jgi:high-affinity iron transporter
MKKFIFLFCLTLFVLSPSEFVHAEEDYGDLFISVGDSIIKVKADDWESAERLVAQLNEDWKQVNQTENKESKNVQKSILKLNKAMKDHQKEAVLSALSDVSHALVAFEKEQNPIDKVEKREEVKSALMPLLTDLKTAIDEENEKDAYTQYQNFLAMWNRKEKIVREQSIAYYGNIETQMGFLRIALTQDRKDFGKIQTIYESLYTDVSEFVSGKNLESKVENYSLQTLVDLLDNAGQAVERKQPEEAVRFLEDFLTVWPSVEGDVRTRNGSLYTELESEIPVIAGKLSSSNVNLEKQREKIKEYKQAIALLQVKTSYTIWDAALIMLREGLEALLIVTALIAFLRKANAPEYQKWIWLGAFIGVMMSIAAAVFINMAFSSTTAGANREVIEGVTGIIAVIMMLGVGMWLHQKSNMKLWNQYIHSKMGTALSTGSVLSMSLVSFLSIFREGAETIIFYMGMAPSISTVKLISGIAMAVVILVVFAFLIIRYSSKISVGPFFKVATILIYFLAFKILGLSIHALQLTNHINTSQINSLPIINWMGFYPTWESTLPQGVIVLIFILTSLKVEVVAKRLGIQRLVSKGP